MCAWNLQNKFIGYIKCKFIKWFGWKKKQIHAWLTPQRNSKQSEKKILFYMKSFSNAVEIFIKEEKRKNFVNRKRRKFSAQKWRVEWESTHTHTRHITFGFNCVSSLINIKVVKEAFKENENWVKADGVLLKRSLRNN